MKDIDFTASILYMRYSSLVYSVIALVLLVMFGEGIVANSHFLLCLGACFALVGIAILLFRGLITGGNYE